jgi:hypothetical protein
MLHLLTAAFGTFLPFATLRHHGSYRGKGDMASMALDGRVWTEPV